MQTPQSDTPQSDTPFSDRQPSPHLFVAAGITIVVEVVLIAHYIFSPTRRRGFCLAASTGNLLLTILNAAVTYYPTTSVFEKVFIVFLGLLSAAEFGLLGSIFLDVGGSFFLESKDARTRLWWCSAVFLAVSIISCVILSVWYTVDQTISLDIIFPLAFVTVSSWVVGLSFSIAYAFIPLISFRTQIQNSMQGDAIAIGIWQVLMVVPWLIIGIVFWAYAFAHGGGNPFTDINMSVDLTLRSLMCLAYGSPPHWKAVCYIREHLSRGMQRCRHYEDVEWRGTRKIGPHTRR